MASTLNPVSWRCAERYRT